MGYYENVGKGTCDACTLNCNKCPNNSCTECVAAFEVKNNVCVPIAEVRCLETEIKYQGKC